MKKSTAVTLVISGALMAGCDDRPRWVSSSTYRTTTTTTTPVAVNPQPQITNNTYVAGEGYWHAPYQGWYPYPYNSYHEGFGYYHGGEFSETPEVSSINASAPADGSNLEAQGVNATTTTTTNQTVIVNNTYIEGRGYWHAAYGGWYPYPWNYYRPGFGYYHGGFFSFAPEIYHVPIVVSHGWSGSSSRGFSSSGNSGNSSGNTASHSSSVARGGFGSSAHSSSS